MGTRAQVVAAIQRGIAMAWLWRREVLGSVGTGAAAVSLRWRAVAGDAEHRRARANSGGARSWEAWWRAVDGGAGTGGARRAGSGSG